MAAAVCVGFACGPAAGAAFANTESAGVVFFGQKTSEGPTELWGAEADGSEPFAIHSDTAPGGGFLGEPALSPDGRSVAVAFGNDIGVIDVETGELTIVYDGSSVPENPSAAHPRWSPNGERLIFVADVSTASSEAIRGHVYTVKKDGTGLEKLTISLPSGQTRMRDPSYSPSGRKIAFAAFTDEAREGHIYIAKADGSAAHSVYTDPGVSTTTALQDVTFSPDGSSLLFVRSGDEIEDEVHRIPVAGGLDTQITNETEDLGSNTAPTWLPSGSKIAYSNYDYRNEEPQEALHVKVRGANGENPEQLFTGFYSTSAPSFRQPEVNETRENEELLNEFRPQLWYDTQESYRTDSPMEETDLWGSSKGLWKEGTGEYTNDLWSGGLEGESAAEIARSKPGLEAGQFHLSLEHLGAEYPTGLEARENDWIDERNEHYAKDAQELEGRTGYVNRDYGRIVAGSEGNLWLEYWFFYYYDDSSFLFLSTGSHEGDWEMMMIKLNPARNPMEVVYAQHENGAHCEWSQTESSGTMPLAYVAVGTHATYPIAGSWHLPSGVPEDDHADGEGGRARPLLVPVSDTSPSWIAWPGHWGGTTPGSVEPGGATSPEGPAGHSQWNDPQAFAESTAGCFDRYAEAESGLQARAATPSAGGSSAEPSAPEILSAVHQGRHIVVSYRLPAGVDRAHAGLIVSVNPVGGSTAPLTETVPRPRAQGKIRLPFVVGPEQEASVLLSLVEGRGRSSVVTAQVE
ncbi:MAG TPA: hypothetical protein VGH14_20360 [Solirubrobacterales bacterium]